MGIRILQMMRWEPDLWHVLIIFLLPTYKSWNQWSQSTLTYLWPLRLLLSNNFTTTGDVKNNPEDHCVFDCIPGFHWPLLCSVTHVTCPPPFFLFLCVTRFPSVVPKLRVSIFSTIFQSLLIELCFSLATFFAVACSQTVKPVLPDWCWIVWLFWGCCSNSVAHVTTGSCYSKENLWYNNVLSKAFHSRKRNTQTWLNMALGCQ